MFWRKLTIFLGVVVMTLIWSCNPETHPELDDPVLAQVYNKSLVLSDLEGILDDSNSPVDSLHQLQTFVERWVTEAILIHEAENCVRQDMNLDKLVRDYRSSLVLTNYEQELFAKELDSVITKNDIQQYFDGHQEQFRLRYDIVRYFLVKVPLSSPNVDMLKAWWKTPTIQLSEEIKQYLRTNGVIVEIQPQKWGALQDLKKKLPTKLRNSLAKAKVMHENNGYLYLLKVYDQKEKGQLPSVSFVRDQVEKIILHGRKMKLIEDKKATLYKKEVNSSNVKIFTN